ncbi:MAG: NarK/NasA family nitrate transporter [Ignavibacteriae bacterium]|nr:NarK/NasA family nitrate transporter [Ignavibacteriota bacterium]MCB9215766.1 NarK/NasA family nitrate transporter [Ignavibacteria bacterium]
MRTIDQWNVEDSAFWNSTGKKIANRNLWISIPCLLLGFAVWMMWSIIIVQMKNLGFVFDPDPAANTALLYTLPAIAGLAGATLRIPNSFLIAIGGGRNVIFTTTALLLIPAVGTGFALQDIHTPYIIFALFAALSGFGGGNFASSMSNISFFFPKRVQGTSLGLNAGLGNLGVSVMQVLLPIAMGVSLFGVIGGEGIPLPQDIGDKVAGTLVYIQNSGLTWVPILVILSIAAWFGMNNLQTASPGLKSTASAIFKVLFLTLQGVIAAGVGLLLLLELQWNMWLVLPITIVLTLLLMKYASPGELKHSLKRQFAIFNNKHNWIMTIIYTMTFGSFIGYSAAFPKLIQDVFGTLADGSVNPNAPNPFHYAWLGPLVGALIRPVGGWISDKVGSGSKVTQWTTVLMIVAALSVAWFVVQAKGAAAPEEFFLPFLILFLILFVATGIGNGSTFRSIPYIFQPEQAGPVLGWTSAVAAYGAFIIPQVFGEQIKGGHPEYALYGFAIYYVICLLLNWWYYERKNSGVDC